MDRDSRIKEIICETSAYKDLDKPVILASGELGIYYINTEKTIQDGGKFEKYGNDSKAMIEHAVKMMDSSKLFKELIEITSEKTEELLKKDHAIYKGISGGQRRDWLFSGPVAHSLGLPHISLYKDGQIETIYFDEGQIKATTYTPNMLVVHIVDLLTEGSSVYRIENDKSQGWVPMLRNNGVKINNLISIVNRNQGADANLSKQDVKTHSFVTIDETFLREYSKYPERAVEYISNPRAWSEAYLLENGTIDLISTFDPDGGKLDRAKKFLNRYESFLEENGKLKELETAIQQTYHLGLHEIFGGK